MILRLDELALDPPKPNNPSVNDAAATQELLGGKFGEMHADELHRSSRSTSKARPPAPARSIPSPAIAAEEYCNIEAVSYAINLPLTGTSERNPRPRIGPAGLATDVNTQLISAVGCAAPADFRWPPWTGDNVFSSGNCGWTCCNFFLSGAAPTRRAFIRW
jgi:Mn-containing catalase